MRRLMAVPVGIMLGLFTLGGTVLADPVGSPMALHLVGTCDDGTGADHWVTVGAGHAVLAGGTTEVRVTLYLEVYSSEGAFLGAFASKAAERVPEWKTTWCSGSAEDGSTFLEYALLSH